MLESGTAAQLDGVLPGSGHRGCRPSASCDARRASEAVGDGVFCRSCAGTTAGTVTCHSSPEGVAGRSW